MNFNLIKKGTPVVLKDRQSNIQKVSSVFSVRDRWVFVRHGSDLYALPSDKIIGLENDNLVVKFVDKNDYNAFWKKIKALNMGAKKIEEFKGIFPQGEMHEIYNTSNGPKVGRVKALAPYIHYLALNLEKYFFEFFAEIDYQLDPEYTIVYLQKKGYFISVPLLPYQADAIDKLNNDFYGAWLIDAKRNFNPENALFTPGKLVSYDKYQNLIKQCERLYTKSIEILIRKKPEKPIVEMDPILNEMNKKVEKYLPNFRFQDKFMKIFDTVIRFNKSSELLNAVRGSITGPSKGVKVLATALGAPIMQLGIPSTYFFPNGEKTLIIILMLSTGFKREFFSYYQYIYLTLRYLHDNLPKGIM